MDGKDDELRSALKQPSRKSQEIHHMSNELVHLRKRVSELEQKAKNEEKKFSQKEHLLKEKLSIAQSEAKKYQQLFNNEKKNNRIKSTIIEDQSSMINKMRLEKIERKKTLDLVLTTQIEFINQLQTDLETMENEILKYQKELRKRDAEVSEHTNLIKLKHQKICEIKKQVELNREERHLEKKLAVSTAKLAALELQITLQEFSREHRRQKKTQHLLFQLLSKKELERISCNAQTDKIISKIKQSQERTQEIQKSAEEKVQNISQMCQSLCEDVSS